MTNLRLAKVTNMHPEGICADLICLDNGDRYPAVMIMGEQSLSDCTGTVDLTEPGLPPSGSAGQSTDINDSTTGPNLIAVCGTLRHGGLIILGFLSPQKSQMFVEAGRRVQRHASDVYTTTDIFGNFELYHPSGTYLRIGESTAHDDLTGRDFKKLWAITKNTGRQPHIHMSVAVGGVSQASLDMAPTGQVTVTSGADTVVNATSNVYVTAANGNINATATTGNITVSAPLGNLNIHAATGAVNVQAVDVNVTATATSITAPTNTITGNLNVIGLISAGGLALTAVGGGTGAAAIAGNVTVTGSINVPTGSMVVTAGDISIAGISIKTHYHTGGTIGGNTGAMV
jgi:phage baseplate assembly protein gpV